MSRPLRSRHGEISRSSPAGPFAEDDDDDNDDDRRNEGDTASSSSYDEDEYYDDHDDDDDAPPVAPPSVPTGGRSAVVRAPSSSPLPSRVAPLLSPSATAASSPSPSGAVAAGAGATTTTTPSLTYESLARRPRSNPRVRTPMRHESPIAVPWNRSTIRRDGDDDDERERERRLDDDGGRVTVRLGAGSSVGASSASGAAARRAAAAAGRTSPPAVDRAIASGPGAAAAARERSSKQGPSKRKIRRWNNDRFVGIAAEIAREAKRKGGGGGPDYAEAFLRGEAEASSYLMPNHPLNYRSAFARLVDDESGDLREVKERFTRGEVAAAAPQTRRSRSSALARQRDRENRDIFLRGELMFLRIQPRLRNVVVRACRAPRPADASSSSMAVRLLDAFESYLARHLSSSPPAPESSEEEGNAVAASATALLNEVLLRPPDDVERAADAADEAEKKKKVAHFRFDPDAPSGAFHRLLLHAVCQFHGLRASSSSSLSVEEESDDRRRRRARVLTVSGECLGPSFRLSDLARRFGNRTEEEEEARATASVVERIAAVRVA